jgi:hypothetical protein
MMNRAFATVAFVWALALSGHVSAGGGEAYHCQTVANGVQSTVDSCWWAVNVETNPNYRQIGARDCERALEAGNQLIQWCNSNIGSCPTDNYGRKRVYWTLNTGLITVQQDVSWSINCY